MKIVHITPTYFDDSSIIGGGERYPSELALWMSKCADTTLVSFSSKKKTYLQGSLKIRIYPVSHFIHGNKVNPLNFHFLQTLAGADIVHIHHIHTLISDMACLVARLLGKPAFVTDYGGGAGFTLNGKLPILKYYRNAITYSQFGKEFLPSELKKKAILIKGGVDTEKFSPDEKINREKTILYVGRLLPHKGINYLIEGFRLLGRQDYKLKIVGRVYNEAYYEYLKKLAVGLNVQFEHNADDQALISEYRRAVVTVLPSVHTDYNNNFTPVPELMGFTLLESQSCGTPVICTDAGGMFEFLIENQTGFVVGQNSGASIFDAITKIIDWQNQPNADYFYNCLRWIKQLDWEKVVSEHLALYKDSITNQRKNS